MTDESMLPDEAAQRRRLKGFGLHMLGYFTVMAVLAGINFTQTPDQVWFVLPLVGWGAPLALHAAWAMGLFDGLFGGKGAGDGRGQGNNE